jgi:hypothetical protein
MKGHNDPLILCAVLLFGAVLVSPAFAGMKKIGEAELAGANASITGASVKDQLAGVENSAVNPETYQAAGTTVNKNTGPSQAVEDRPISLNLNIKGTTTFLFYFGGGTSDVTVNKISGQSH